MLAPRAEAPRILVVTNDFPPTVGGIQTYVRDYLDALATHGTIPAANITVFASTQDSAAAAEFDQKAPYSVVRIPRKIMLPSPRVARQMAREIAKRRIDTVWFAAAAPLAVLAPIARAAGARRIIASTHGHEVGWSLFPGARGVLKFIGRNVDTVTYVSRYVRDRIAGVFGPTVAWEPMPGGVDANQFAPNPDLRQELRARYGLENKKVIVAVSRVVPRKGQDTLVAAMPRILREVPDAHLLIVGPGSYSDELRTRAEKLGISENVTFTGTVDMAELAGHYCVGDVFALPVRTQGGGLSVEGLGIVFLEAQAAGVPTIAGDGGGAPETVIDGVTGEVVDGRNADHVAERIITLLNSDDLRTKYAEAGMKRTKQAWQWSALATQLEYVLRGDQGIEYGAPPRHSWNYPVDKQ